MPVCSASWRWVMRFARSCKLSQSPNAGPGCPPTSGKIRMHRRIVGRTLAPRPTALDMPRPEEIMGIVAWQKAAQGRGTRARRCRAGSMLGRGDATRQQQRHRQPREEDGALRPRRLESMHLGASV